MIKKISQSAKLTKAKINKKDEFYTRYNDIENELKHYPDSFRDKIVYCNCDDYEKSNFFKYFRDNFKSLGLKELVATCYDNGEGAKIARYDGVNLSSGFLKGNGDFASNECKEILKHCDIVVTNPPFSLFREYIDQLFSFKKKFLIIAHQNALTNPEIFDKFRDNHMWLGYGFKGWATYFINNHYENYATGGKKLEGLIRVSGVIWLTNLQNDRINDFIKLSKKYDSKSFLKYDNYDAINIDRVENIPHDYDGVMGVPITFIHKYNPKQFEIVNLRKGQNGEKLTINNRVPYCRLLIRHKRTEGITWA